MVSNEWAVSEDDLKGGGGYSAKPRGKYVGEISRATTKKDAKGKLFIKFGAKITRGKFKGGLAFENYLVLSRDTNAYQAARRNSFYKAIALKAGTIPPGAPGGADVSVLNGTVIGFTLEHEFQNVPGYDYTSISTSSSNKQPWKSEGWEKRLNDKGELYLDANDQIIRNEDGDPEPIKPREIITFYELDDDFDGLGGGDDDGGTFGSSDDSADEDGWG